MKLLYYITGIPIMIAVMVARHIYPRWERWGGGF
jgi:hypothetical protein